MANELLSMSQQFSGLPMEDLIGGPLNAVAKANASMSFVQAKFILDTCFTADETETLPKKVTYKPVMITMSLERGVISYAKDDNESGTIKKGDPQIRTVVTKFNLPLLTIIPINSLGVNSADIGFEMEVKSSYSETEHNEAMSETQAEGSIEGKLGWGVLSVSLKGTASYSSKDSSTHDTHYEKSNSAKYTINVQAGQLPVPKGVNTIIDAFSQAIQPIELPSESQNK